MVGSGKTTVLVHKVLYLHFIKKVPLDRMAVLTFTNKAANVIKERIMTFYMQNNDCVPDFSLFGTFHSVARNVLKNSHKLADLGYTSDFTIMDEDEKKEFYLRIADELYLNVKYRNKINKRIERYLDNLSKVKQQKILYGNMKNEDDLKKLVEIGCERKKQNNVMDFDDLINNANFVLSHPESNFHPKWIVVDEFQDCNLKQIEMIMNMANDSTLIFAVGDPNQLIYTWRGSDLSIFYDFKLNECKEHRLPINYRSTSNILDVAKFLISYDTKELRGTRKLGSPVFLINHYDSNQEAIYLANTIKILNGKGVPFREIAILFRTKRQSQIFETVFEREAIPFEVTTRQTLRDIPSLHWLTQLLKACVNKQDLNSIYDAICNENYGIVEPSKVLLKKYKASMDKSDVRTDLEKFIEWLSTNINNGNDFLNFATKMLQFIEWLENRTYAEIPNIFDYFELSTNLRPTSINYSKDVELVKKFLEEVSKYVQLSYDTAIKSSFLAAISVMTLGGYQTIGETIDPNSEKVKLLTMHSAKGLEFRYVFISGANNGLIPLKYANITAEQIEEEKRLFFVAITRAKDYLEISYHTEPEGWNSSPEPSIYLNEIPKDLLKSKQAEKFIEEDIKSDNKTVDKVGQWYMGEIVKHPKYGTGTISKISKANIVCDFEKFGEKSFAINFLPILPVEIV
jgi:DNA helicase-2/ATP-dependent DNA helicase PcrA